MVTKIRTIPVADDNVADDQFAPRSCVDKGSGLEHPSGKWITMLESKCTFSHEIFSQVMLNLIKNPNIMSSHLFRADVFYDSENDTSTLQNGPGEATSTYTKHMKKEYQPIYLDVPGFEWQRTFVRQLVPRNRQLDKDLVQTCHFYTKKSTTEGLQILVIYIPHTRTAEELPYYHPQVTHLAFLHLQPKPSEDQPSPNSQDPTATASSSSSKISLHFSLFPDHELTPRLTRTALQMLAKIHKHGQGQQKGYTKRVHHDLIVPQQRFQDTYARLKAKYAKVLIGDWAEQTDPGKHVFEDLGIAAFLIEVWRDMYGGQDGRGGVDENGEGPGRSGQRQGGFPGFVDIGCGNGILVHILIQEGYEGWGFDARRRKTWDTFPSSVRDRVEEMVLVPRVLDSVASTSSPSTESANDAEVTNLLKKHTHPGIFPPGTFIISNHADELTPWTPLLAYLSDCPFIAIPCCSHNLAGQRFRAPKYTHFAPTPSSSPPSPLSTTAASSSTLNNDVSQRPVDNEKQISTQAAETGSLSRPVNEVPTTTKTNKKGNGDANNASGRNAANQMPSAYASLCTYVQSLASEVGFRPEKEMLRIPSTRNACIFGRGVVNRNGSEKIRGTPDGKAEGKGELECEIESLTLGTGGVVGDGDGVENGHGEQMDGREKERREEVVRGIVERELRLPLARVRDDWIAQAKMILGKKGDGH